MKTPFEGEKSLNEMKKEVDLRLDITLVLASGNSRSDCMKIMDFFTSYFFFYIPMAIIAMTMRAMMTGVEREALLLGVGT